MNVFLSWSGDRSKALATALNTWLAKVIQGVKPWLSDKSIDPGERWNVELQRALETCRVHNHLRYARKLECSLANV